MATLQKRIATLIEAADNWLDEENHYLADAIDRTVREGYFSLQDVRYAIDALKKSLSEKSLLEWAERATLTDENDAEGENVLCLHAGNLPMVGFQDALATLLTGARYSGKISRKDPYLLPTFLNEVKKTELWSDMDVQWTHRLDDFEDMRHDNMIFAGSESSVPGVKKEIQRLNLAKKDARFLIRTAHFSMAYIDQNNDQTIQNLTDAILRYGGKGCRSVAVVVSPYSLDEVRGELKKAAKSFWIENPQHQKPAPKLKQQYAYNRAVECPQLWLEYFLVQEGGIAFDQDFIYYWIQGDKTTAAQIADQNHEQLQSIYVSDTDGKIPGWNERTELLSNAQQPHLSWKPDGVDTLRWLTGYD